MTSPLDVDNSPVSKSEYDPVSNNEEDEEDIEEMALANDDSIDEECLRGEPRWQVLLNTNLVSDDSFTIYGVRLVDGPPAIKLLKFLVFTYSSIFIAFKFIRWVDWENDPNFNLDNFWTYESVDVTMDTVFFFFIGRLYQQRGVDHLAWALAVVFSNIFSSYITNLSFLQHSFTLYEMHCRWPWELWLFIACVVPIVFGFLFLHVRKAYRDNVMIMKAIELATCFWFLLVPFMRSPYIHLHHWYNGFLIGMHLNFDVWWSRLAMAFCWGMYINGIAVYGRDPVLSCAYGLYISAYQYCPYLECYLDGISKPPSNDTPPVIEMVPRDWRNCSSGLGYAP